MSVGLRATHGGWRAWRCWRCVVLGLAVVLCGLAGRALWPPSGYAEWMPAWMPMPAEDAYILYRYSANLADGHGIRWNRDELPVDGSTDFLWMLVLAAWATVFGSVIPGNYLLGVLFAVLLAGLGHFVVHRLAMPPPPGWLYALTILLGPIVYHVVNGYGVPLYAMVLGLALAGALLMLLRSTAPDDGTLACWGLALLAAGLARPEGNVFCAILVAAVAFRLLRTQRGVGRMALWVGLVYLLPGALILVGRHAYFGEVLPAPFFVKVASASPWALASKNLQLYGLPVALPQILLTVPVMALARGSRRATLLTLLGAVWLFSLPHLFFHQTQNDSMRFEYPFFALSALIAVTALGSLMQSPGRRGTTVVAVVSLVAAWLVFALVTRPSPQIRDSRWQVASLLGEYQGDRATLATTEAGAVPFISGWRTLDTYGLNDYSVGQSGIGRDRWREIEPTLVLNHSPNLTDPADEKPGGGRRRMYELMREDGRYVPVAAIAVRRWLGRPPAGYHLYFLRRDAPEYEALATAVNSLEGESYAQLPTSFAVWFSHRPSRPEGDR